MAKTVAELRQEIKALKLEIKGAWKACLEADKVSRQAAKAHDKLADKLEKLQAKLPQ